MIPKHEPEAKRYSGIRLKQQDPAWRAAEYEQQLNGVLAFREMFEAALRTPNCCDDEWRAVGVEQLVDAVLRSGEVFICFTADKEVAGFQALFNVKPGRSATWFGYAVPSVRKTPVVRELAREVLGYAFTVAPEGLGLLKVRAEVACKNAGALALCDEIGFTRLAVVPYDTLQLGRPEHIMLLELYNPSVFAPAGEVIDGSRHRGIQSGGAGDVAVDEPADADAAEPVHEPVRVDSATSSKRRRSRGKHDGDAQRAAGRAASNEQQ